MEDEPRPPSEFAARLSELVERAEERVRREHDAFVFDAAPASNTLDALEDWGTATTNLLHHIAQLAEEEGDEATAARATHLGGGADSVACRSRRHRGRGRPGGGAVTPTVAMLGAWPAP